MVAAVIRLRLIVGFLSVGNREGCQKDTVAVPTVLLFFMVASVNVIN